MPDALQGHVTYRSCHGGWELPLMPDFIMPEPKGNDEGWRTEVLIERAKAFVQAVAAQAPWAEIEPYYAPDVSQEEFPNRLLPKGTIRNLEALREARPRAGR